MGMGARQSFIGKPRVQRLLACFCLWHSSAFVVQLTHREAVRRFTQQDKRHQWACVHARRDLVVRREARAPRRLRKRGNGASPSPAFFCKTSRAFCPDAALPRRCRASLATAATRRPRRFRSWLVRAPWACPLAPLTRIFRGAARFNQRFLSARVVIPPWQKNFRHCEFLDAFHFAGSVPPPLVIQI